MSDQLRLSDAERELAAADLGEHFAQGRLTADEHAERLDQIWAAKTRGEIAPIFSDLPSAYAARPPRAASYPEPGKRGSRRWWWTSRGGYPVTGFAILAVLIAISTITHFPVVLVGVLVWWFLVFKRGSGHGHWR
jgi:hypothetical protein